LIAEDAPRRGGAAAELHAAGGRASAGARCTGDQNPAGYRIAGADGGINLARYAAWLCDRRHTPAAEFAAGYLAVKEAARRRAAALSLSGRDIGDLPDVSDPARKAACERDFRLFCESYFPETFSLAWSDDHLKVIAKIEQAVLHGGLFAVAMPRGSGKSSLSECACLRAILYGHREFVALVGATRPPRWRRLKASRRSWR
jgi:hypothetical protein